MKDKLWLSLLSIIPLAVYNFLTMEISAESILLGGWIVSIPIMMFVGLPLTTYLKNTKTQPLYKKLSKLLKLEKSIVLESLFLLFVLVIFHSLAGIAALNYLGMMVTITNLIFFHALVAVYINYRQHSTKKVNALKTTYALFFLVGLIIALAPAVPRFIPIEYLL